MAFLGNENQSWQANTIGGSVNNITTSYGSWGNFNTSYYKWTVPDAGTYELHANLRTRIWGTTGFTKYVVFRNSDSSRAGDQVRMGVEFQNSGVTNNTQQHFVWIVSTTQNGDTWYLQGQSSVNSSGHSIQSDGNGYNQCWWRRLN